MDPIVFEDQDFSADDDVCDPNYVPTKVIRNIVSESEPAVSAKRMRSTRSSPKLIFNPEFYVAMVMYVSFTHYLPLGLLYMVMYTCDK